ncbi:MAG TPA: hypothetical protein VF884_14815 [Nitrososphaeraceae archaeon]
MTSMIFYDIKISVRFSGPSVKYPSNSVVEVIKIISIVLAKLMPTAMLMREMGFEPTNP